MLDLIRDIILATDLAHHLRIFKDLQKMADGMSQFSSAFCNNFDQLAQQNCILRISSNKKGTSLL